MFCSGKPFFLFCVQDAGDGCHVSVHAGLSRTGSSGGQSFFFCRRIEKYRNSSRFERTVSGIGHWKITSSDMRVTNEYTGEEIGKKKKLTFYRGRIPNGNMTNWGMHEYHLKPSCLGYADSEEVLVFIRTVNSCESTFMCL